MPSSLKGADVAKLVVPLVVMLLLVGGRLFLSSTSNDAVFTQRNNIQACLPKVQVSSGTALAVQAVPPTSPDVSSKVGRCLGGPDESFTGSVVEVTALGTLTLTPASSGANIGTATAAVTKQTYEITKQSGPFELATTHDMLASIPGESQTLCLPKEVYFSPGSNATYRVQLRGAPPAAAPVDPEVKNLQVPARTKLDVVFDNQVEVLTSQVLKGQVWVDKSTTKSLLFRRVAGRDGLMRLTSDSPGLFGPSQTSPSLWACAGAEDGGAGQLATAAISDSKLLAVDLPNNTLPTDWSWGQRVWVAVASTDGKTIAAGTIHIAGQWLAGLISSAFIALIFMVVSMLLNAERKNAGLDERPLSGLFTGPDKDPSLSLLQVFIWTIITLWGMAYVFLVTGSLISLTPEMTQLLGIAGVGSVAARWIAASSGSTSTPVGSAPTVPANANAKAPAPQHQKDLGSPGDFYKLLSTNGRMDLLKVQLFAFTAVIAVYVAVHIAQTASFPMLDSNTLLLLGVSQGIYVTSKLAGVSSLAKAQAIKAQLDALAQRKADVPADNAALTQDLVTQEKQLNADYDVAIAGLGLKRV